MRSLILDILLYSAAIAASILLLANTAADVRATEFSSSSPADDVAANSSDLHAASQYLISNRHLAAGDRAICIGPGSAAAADTMRRLGFQSADAVVAECHLARFESDSFDLAIGVDLDRVPVPARAVLEMERVIKPGRVGAVLRVGSDLMRAAAPVVALLRFSDVVGATAVNGSVMVVFRKWGPVSNVNNDRLDCCYDGLSRLPSFFHGIYEVLRAASLVGGVYAGHLV